VEEEEVEEEDVGMLKQSKSTNNLIWGCDDED